jgi:hypothetical protein
MPTPSFSEFMREQGGAPGAMKFFRNIIIAMLITIVLWAVIISGAWWVGITVSAKNELTPQQRIDEAFEALKGGSLTNFHAGCATSRN